MARTNDSLDRSRSAYISTNATGFGAHSLRMVFFLLILSYLLAAPWVYGTQNLGIKPGQIRNLVSFGDSWSDVFAKSQGRQAWPVYAAGYANVSLFPFAKAGGSCSLSITPIPFPNVTVFETQLPAYFNASLHLNMKETLFSLWIGVNDLGQIGLLTGMGVPGKTVVDTTACAIDWLKVLYKSGARNFLMQNLAPLEIIPIYTPSSYPNKYWTAQRNTTEWSIVMKELSSAANALSALMLHQLLPEIPGAHVGIFDSHGLYQTMHDNPERFYNGTAPLNVTSPVNTCIFQLNEDPTHTGDCTIALGSDRDSFMWWDELHPSEQTDRNVARAISEVILGQKSKLSLAGVSLEPRFGLLAWLHDTEPEGYICIQGGEYLTVY